MISNAEHIPTLSYLKTIKAAGWSDDNLMGSSWEDISNYRISSNKWVNQICLALKVKIMEISGASSASASVSTTVAIEVQKKTQDLQKETAASLIEALPQPDPTSSLGQNINLRA